jgi:DNA-binding XRE family transcriptional regulator
MDLRMIRAIKEQRQWDLGKATGIHQSKISLIEHGHIIATEEEKAALARALGVSVSDIDWPEESFKRCQEVPC